MHSKDPSFWRVSLDERTVFFEQMRDELALEKIGRFAHRALMMAIETKNVWQKTHTQLCFGNSQPQVVVLPPKPTEFVQFVIITADFDELHSIEHCHCIDIGKLDQHLWIPIKVGKQSFPITLAALKTAEHRVNSGGTVCNHPRVQLFKRTRKHEVVRVHDERIRPARQLQPDVPRIG